MNKFWLPVNTLFGCAILGAFLFASCVNQQIKPPVLNLPPKPESSGAKREYNILDYKNKSRGETVPEWFSLWQNSGVHGIETMDNYNNRFVFIRSSEGNSFNALNLWKDNFSPELDFPRMAASRIEERFSAGIPFPDEEYGGFYEALVRAASDATWMGAVKADDFWIRKKNLPTEDEGESENWEFLILVTMEKSRFTSQLDLVFEKVNPNSTPTVEQIAAINRVKDHFFEGF